MRRLVYLSLCVLLAGCGWVGRQTDALGSYIPVIGERCEHWQCVTPEGEAISNAYKEQERAEEEKAKATKAAASAKQQEIKPLLTPAGQ